MLHRCFQKRCMQGGKPNVGTPPAAEVAVRREVAFFGTLRRAGGVPLGI